MIRQNNLADFFEIVADAVPDRPAIITNEIEFSYSQLDDRITRLANHLLSIGIKRGDWVAVHAMNRHEWVEAFYACAKIGAAAVNVNYRYLEEELRYIYDNADCVAAIVAPEYLDVVQLIQASQPRLKNILVMGPEYEKAIADASPVRNFDQRSGDDVYVLYTGGTTGMPKGVVWRSEDIALGAMNSARQKQPINTPEQLGQEAAAAPAGMRLMAIGPMMHGGGQWLMGNAFVAGGTLVLYTLARFDAHAIWALAERGKANSISTVGDAMARPLAEALLEVPPKKYDLSNMFSVGNGGAPLTSAVREQLRQALPNILILDSFGASETGAAGSKMDDGAAQTVLRFDVGPDCTVLDDNGNECAIGVVGRLARSGYIPLRYHKDEAKTAATFPVYNGKRWVVPGDAAFLETPGVLTLLGRGSQCINSGGEKIYPEEVEQALMQHGMVFDVVVAGTPNERWGQQVTALVQLRPGSTASIEELREHCRRLIADYKVPKEIFFVPLVQRTPVGKADYKWAVAQATLLAKP